MLSIGLDVPVTARRIIWRNPASWPSASGVSAHHSPAYTLGGTGGGIAYNREEFEVMARRGLELSPVSEILIEESLLGWKEFEMEVMRDKGRQLRHYLLH